MSKLSRAQRSAHNQALEILKKECLSESEKEFVLENYHEGATSIQGDAGAFFTPLDLAWDFALECNYNNGEGSYIDLCAGIGVLSFCVAKRYKNIERLVCIELNPEYVRVGKKILPEAEWHCLDALNIEALEELGYFDVAVSNPPFNKVRTMKGKTTHYRGAKSEFKVMDIASQIASYGVFIVPQMSAGFQYSGVQCFEERKNSDVLKFEEQTGVNLECGGIGIDTSCYSEFKNAKVRVEIVCTETPRQVADVFSTEQQLDLFVA